MMTALNFSCAPYFSRNHVSILFLFNTGDVKSHLQLLHKYRRMPCRSYVLESVLVLEGVGAMGNPGMLDYPYTAKVRC